MIARPIPESSTASQKILCMPALSASLKKSNSERAYSSFDAQILCRFAVMFGLLIPMYAASESSNSDARSMRTTFAFGD